MALTLQVQALEDLGSPLAASLALRHVQKVLHAPAYHRQEAHRVGSQSARLATALIASKVRNRSGLDEAFNRLWQLGQEQLLTQRDFCGLIDAKVFRGLGDVAAESLSQPRTPVGRFRVRYGPAARKWGIAVYVNRRQHDILRQRVAVLDDKKWQPLPDSRGLQLCCDSPSDAARSAAWLEFHSLISRRELRLFYLRKSARTLGRLWAWATHTIETSGSGEPGTVGWTATLALASLTALVLNPEDPAGFLGMGRATARVLASVSSRCLVAAAARATRMSEEGIRQFFVAGPAEP